MNAVAESATDPGPRVTPSARWVDHFRANVYRDWRIPWECDAPLPAPIRARIAGSIAAFQRGESSEAFHYLAKSEIIARCSADPDFHAASILFVREENNHAGLLLRFMRRVGIPPRRKVFSDGVFRRLRALSDLGWSSRVLLIAELIAQEYYPCLRMATEHPTLVRICDQIVGDEEAHVRFQVERIASLETGLPWRIIRWRDICQTVLMVGAAGVVYLGHLRVLSARPGFGRFLTSVLQRNRAAIRAMHALFR
jgi:hypothetical protein